MRTSVSGVLAILILSTTAACGQAPAASPAASASAAQAGAASAPAASAPISAAPAPPSATAKPKAAIELPAHGSLLYELKFGQASDISPYFGNSTLDKLRPLDDGLEFTASPKGNAGIRFAGATVDNFILSARLRTGSGAGEYVMSLRRVDG